MKIVVYCSANDDLPEEIQNLALTLGRWIGQGGHTLVYGGVNAGLMHLTAQAASDAGCRDIVGVVPSCFTHRADPLCTAVVETRDLNDRKSRMVQAGDAFVVLPGGIGTIDEWISTLSQQKVSGTAKPIIVVNYNNMYAHMIEQLAATAASQFARPGVITGSVIVGDAESLIESLNKL